MLHLLTALALTARGVMDPTVRLRNGVEMPLVACGTGGDSSAEAQSGVAVALKAGVTHIDTAHDYTCLPGVGAAIAEWLQSHERASLFLTSKVPGCGVPTQGLQPPCFDNTFAMATKDIATLVGGANGQIDLLLLHFPPLEGCGGASCTKMQEQWAALEQLYASKKTRAIGVSNYCETCIKCIEANATVMPMVNQIQVRARTVAGCRTLDAQDAHYNSRLTSPPRPPSPCAPRRLSLPCPPHVVRALC